MSELRVGSTSTLSGIDSYRYVDTLYFTSSGTFVKADYPHLRAIRVKCQGAGGGGGGTDYCATNSESAAGSGGGGGSYAESFILADTLGPTESLLVGAGGAGGAGAASEGVGLDGNDGGNSSFASGEAHQVIATGGKRGYRGAETTSYYGASGSNNCDPSTGDITISGQPSESSFSGGQNGSYTMAKPSSGGSSRYGVHGRSFIARTNSTATIDGLDGVGYGAGGNGGCAAATSSPAAGGTGGSGSNGIIVVELYA